MLKVGIEPTTLGFSVQCSTTELLELFFLNLRWRERESNPQRLDYDSKILPLNYPAFHFYYKF